MREIFNNENICTSRSESKKLDDAKIDVADPDNVMEFYIQAKSTQNTPSIKQINEEVGLKDKPLVILWNAQEKREVNCISVGKYAIMPYEYFKKLINKNEGN